MPAARLLTGGARARPVVSEIRGRLLLCPVNPSPAKRLVSLAASRMGQGDQSGYCSLSMFLRHGPRVFVTLHPSHAGLNSFSSRP